MEKKTKQLILFVGAIFVAIIFLSSYASLNNNNSGGTSTASSTVSSQVAFYATGDANGIIVNYSDVVYIYVSNASNASAQIVGNELSGLEANGTVQDYVYINGSYQVILSSIPAYDFQQLIYNRTGQTSNIVLGGTAEVELPRSVTLYYSTYPISVTPPGANYSVYMRNLESPGTALLVHVSALLTQSGAVYDNNFRLSYQPNPAANATSAFNATGTANALIVNYSGVAYINVSNASNATAHIVTSELSYLESNGSVKNYTYMNGSYQVMLSGISAYDLQQLLYNKTNSENSLTLASNAEVELPGNIILYYNTTHPISALPPSRNYSVYMKGLDSLGTTITVQISALLEPNGTVYGNDFELSYK